MHLAMVREDFDTGDTELTIFSDIGERAKNADSSPSNPLGVFKWWL